MSGRPSDTAAPGDFPIAVLASGNGSNLQAILDTIHGRTVTLVGVASDRPGCRALERAAAAGIEAATFPAANYPDREARDHAMAGWLQARGAELVVLAGYMQLLTPAFVAAFRNRIVNVHPALLPSFPGLEAVEQALAHGVKVTGVTVHFVDEGVDSGPIILQEALPVSYPADAGAVTEQLHAIEHRLLPRAIELIAAGTARIAADGGRVVLLEG